MASVEKQFIDNLQNFTESLENIVELLKQQAEKGDAINNFLSAMDNAKISDVTIQMAEVLKVSKETNDRTKQILQEIKESRKQKEKGMFDKIETKDNKKKIVDGIQTVILIAGGVLAIGLAFKIIGKVDFLSVIALSLGMLAVSKAFAEIAKIEELTPKKTLMVGLALIAIAGAITISSFILKTFQPLTVAQMMSFVIVSASIGAGAYFIFKAVKTLDMKPSDVWKYLLLPVILPAIAAGLTLSSFSLKFLQPISIMQGISAVFIGLALAAGAFAITLIVKNLKDKEGKIDIKGIGLALLIIPGIALGLTLSSLALKFLQPISIMQGLSAIFIGLALAAGAFAVSLVYKALKGKEGEINVKGIGLALALLPGIALGIVISSVIFLGFQPLKVSPFQVILGSLAMGLSMIAFLPAVYIIGKKMDYKEILKGSLGVIAIATTVVISSLILGLGDYGKYPPFMWTLGVGLSLIVFALPVFLMSKMDSKNIFKGGINLLLVSATVMATSWIVGLGKYENYPKVSWALGVGLSLIAFSLPMIVLGLIGPTVLMGAIYTIAVAATIVATSYILGIGKYEEYPSDKWALGVGLSLILFTVPMIALGLVGPLVLLGAVFTIAVAATIVATSYILGEGKYDTYPPAKWAAGVGLSFLLLTPALVLMGVVGVVALIGAFFIKRIASIIVSISDIFSKGTYDTFPSTKWIDGVGLTFVKIIPAMLLMAYVGPAVLIGSVFSLLIAKAIVKMSDTFNQGKYGIFPSTEWMKGVGLSLSTIVPTMMRLALLGPIVLVGSLFAVSIAKVIVSLSNTFNEGRYDTYPPVQWVSGVGLSFITLAPSMAILALLGPVILIGALVAKEISKMIVSVADILGKGRYDSYPSQDWMTGVSDSIINFVRISEGMKIRDLIKSNLFMTDIARSMVEVSNILSKGVFSGGPTKDWANGLAGLFEIVNMVPEKDKLKRLQDFIEVLQDFSKAAEKIKESGIDKLTKLTANVTIMSVIDDQKLQSVIKVLDDNKSNLSNILEGRDNTQVEVRKQITPEVEKVGIGGEKGGTKDKQDIMIERFDTVIKKFDQLLEFVVQEQGPENTGKSDTTKR